MCQELFERRSQCVTQDLQAAIAHAVQQTLSTKEELLEFKRALKSAAAVEFPEASKIAFLEVRPCVWRFATLRYQEGQRDHRVVLSWLIFSQTMFFEGRTDSLLVALYSFRLSIKEKQATGML